MELSQLEAFLAVIREGSFSAAAKALYRTQPAISQTIKRLEDEVGRPLFDRASRRGLLTDAGRVLAVHAERLVNFRQQALAALDDVRQLRSGRLTVAANELTCLYLLPVLHEYRRLYPDVHVTVQRALASRIPSQVLDYGADLGIVTFRPDLDQLTSIVVYRDELAFVVPPSHPFARRARLEITELEGESFVAHHVASPYRHKVIETFQDKRVQLQMPVELPTIDAIKKFVAMGNGVALLPAIAIEAELVRKELIRVQVPDLAFERELRLVHRRDATLSHAAQAFLAVVEAQTAVRKGRFAFTAES
ncbi:MAG: LysR family transcriptional regulator [Acidobacteriota bacterium]|nr:LysR family transcriptional regulator [Acidobacteriota bacterium]